MHGQGEPGHRGLDDDGAGWAEGLTRRATARPGQAPLLTLASPFANQDALLGVLSALFDRDVQLRSVERLEAESVADVPVEDS